jgi:hypothetical protein
VRSAAVALVRGVQVEVEYRATVEGVGVPESELPRVDLSRLPMARLEGAWGARWSDGRVFALCVAAPSDRYVSGIEPILFDRATALALTALDVRAYDPSRASLARDPRTVSQRVTARPREAPSGADGVRGDVIEIEHVLGFAGAEREALICTAACVGPAARCGSVMLRLAGDVRDAPAPGILARATIAAAQHPRGALALGVVVGLAALALLLARRPRAHIPAESARYRAEPERALRK